jgi:hypothetical protein
LKAKGCGDRIVIFERSSPGKKGSLAVFPAESHANLDDRGKHKDSGRLIHEFPGPMNSLEKRMDRHLDTCIDFSRTGGRRFCPERHKAKLAHQNEGKSTESAYHGAPQRSLKRIDAIGLRDVKSIILRLPRGLAVNEMRFFCFF